MKFEVDLNKVDTKTLEVFVELKKRNLLREIKNDVEKVDERKKLLEELGDDKISKIKPIPIERKFVVGRRKLDYAKLVEKAKKYIRTTNEKYTITTIYNLITNKPIGFHPGGKLIDIFRIEFEKNLWGIRKVKIGRTRFGYVNAKFVEEEHRQEDKKKRINNISDERRDYLSRRGNFVMSRANNLMKNNPYLTRNEAVTRAGEEWKQHDKPKQDIKIDNNVSGLGHRLPNITGLQSEYKPILATMLKHCALNKGRLEYDSTSYALAIPDFTIWNDFLISVMANIKDICIILDIEDRFRIVKYEGHNVLECC